jgi:hypothetical protein
MADYAALIRPTSSGIGIQVAPTAQPNDPLHSTAVVPNPLSDAQAQAASGAFAGKITNLYRGLGPGRNLSVIGQ